MKKILFAAALLLISITAEAQYDWEKIYYYHNSGPVSPEYQFVYNILISADGTGKLDYTKSGKTIIYDFNVSRKGLNMLNNSLLKTKLLSDDFDTLYVDNDVIGGAVNTCTIALKKPEGWKKRKYPIITIPNGFKYEHADKIFSMYQTMEMLVPESVWKRAENSEE